MSLPASSSRLRSLQAPSHRCLSVGTSVLVAVLAATSPGCKQKTKRGAAQPPPHEVAPAAEMKLSPSLDPWVDVLKDPDKLAFQNGASVSGGKLALPARSQAIVRDSSDQTDGAIRMAATYDPSATGVALSARVQDSGSRYTLALTSETVVRLSQVLSNGEATLLKDFSVPAALSPGQAYELELRVVGATLSAKLNGQVLGEVQEASLTTGTMGVQMETGGNATIGALQYLPLGNSQATTSAADEHWVNAIEESDFVKRAGEKLKVAPEGSTITGWIGLVTKPVKNGGIRVTMANTTRNSPLRLVVRNTSGQGQYYVYLNTERGVTLRRNDKDRGDMVLGEFPIPPDAQRQDDIQIEVRAVGPRLIIKLNGEDFANAEDPTFKEGILNVDVSRGAADRYGEPVVKKLEYMVLDR